MTMEIKMKPLVDYDGVLSNEERKMILSRLESAFSIVGASIPEKITINGETFKLRKELRDLIMKKELTITENKHIEKLIATLENQQKFLKHVVQREAITEQEAMDISDKICGIIRAVQELREIIKKAPKAKAMDAKSELMRDVEDQKRWIKYTKKVK